MTLYAVLGDGTMPTKEVAKQLDDLWKLAEDKDQDFWFVMEGKATASETDKDIVSFFNKGGIHYCLMVPDGLKPDEAYTDVAEYIDVTDLGPETIKEVLQMLPSTDDEGGAEDAVVLALFSDISGDSPADELLIAQLTATITAGHKAYALNDAMEEIELRTEAAVELPPDAVLPKTADVEPEDVPKVEDEAPAEDEDDEPLPLDKTYLDGLTAAEVKELAKGMGIPYTNKADAIAAILSMEGTKTEQGDVVLVTEDAEEEVVAPDPTAVVPTAVPGAAMEDAEADFVEVDGEVVPTGAPILDFGQETVTHAEVYEASITFKNVETPTPDHKLNDNLTPLEKADINSSAIAVASGYEIQFSYHPKAKNGTGNQYRRNGKYLVITDNVVRACQLVLARHEGEMPEIHQIVKRSEGNVLVDSVVLP